MSLSTLDVFSIGIGPSSSHTVGPMRAAKAFVTELARGPGLGAIRRVQVELFGSLAATGRGHGTDRAVVLGLEGDDPETVDTGATEERFHRLTLRRCVTLLGTHPIEFDPDRDITFRRSVELPGHPNALTFTAHGHDGAVIRSDTYYSIGGGFVSRGPGEDPENGAPVPHEFSTANELLSICRETGLSISGVMLENELAMRSETQVREGIARVWQAMRQCVVRGCESGEAVLPGRLRVPRRAPALWSTLSERGDRGRHDAGDWVALFALAVNEENPAGGRVVTAPTNGAAGIVPAVLHYYVNFVPGATEEGVFRFFLTAAAIASLFKRNASISGAEVGCQGEIGSACSMAAAALCEALGGAPEQVENAAEIGIEHHLGLTCDPVGGLVQIPCIERNAIAGNTAITAAGLALHGDGSHKVSLDAAILTMRLTGADMKDAYKETSRGGLAVNVVEC
jgi:L-serine dehydratase